MAKAKSTKRGRRKAKPHVKKVSAEIIRDRIEEERRRLQRARAILVAAQQSAMHGAECDYCDIMAVATDLIDAAVEALDSVALRRVLS